MEHLSFLKMAVDEAFKGMRSGEGGPFGAVITRDGRIIGKGHNTVLISNDPTAHAEINAIRDACGQVNDHRLTGAVIYTNFEPCPMCLSAIYWADIRSLYYCKGRSDAELMGFMDARLYHEISLKEEQREMKISRISVPEMEALMQEWLDLDGKNLY